MRGCAASLLRCYTAMLNKAAQLHAMCVRRCTRAGGGAACMAALSANEVVSHIMHVSLPTQHTLYISADVAPSDSTTSIPVLVLVTVSLLM